MSEANKQHEVLIDGEWIREESAPVFSSKDPNTAQAIVGSFPVSSWATCDRALESAHAAFRISRGLDPAKIAAFLEDYASRIQADAAGLVEIAHRETGLAKSPRLMDVELPRTVNQLRLAAKAAMDESWRTPVIDRAANIRSCYIALGPVA
jgi:NADP-dependent aldehyde dehydrogenase